MKTYEERTQSINKKAKRMEYRRNAYISVAACVCLIALVCCAVFIPNNNIPQNIRRYSTSDYFSLIEKLNGYNTEMSKADMGCDVAVDMIESPTAPEGLAPDASAPGTSAPGEGSSSSSNFEETTLNQVEGVAEGDIVKRTTTHAFYLKIVDSFTNNGKRVYNYRVNSFLLDAEQTTCSDSFEINAEKDSTFYYDYSGKNAEMYISDDGNTATILVNCRNSEGIIYTCVISLDISDPSNISEKQRTYVAGKYLSSRKVNGELLLVTNFYVKQERKNNRYEIDYDKLQNFVPSYGSIDNLQYFVPEEIYLPDDLTNCCYTVVVKVAETSLEVTSRNSLLSYTEEVAVSQNHVFVLRTRNGRFDENCQQIEKDAQPSYPKLFTQCTEIVCLSYDNGLETEGEIRVPGSVKDRYSVDEHNGILRVATTLRTVTPDNEIIWSWAGVGIENAGLYCVDLSTKQIVAKEEFFAPDDESVQAARFDGDFVYVCTAVGFSDPVYKFDLSNLNNISYKQTKEITGYSFSLVKFGDYLLGIGYADSRTSLKIELYRETVDGIESVAVYEQQDCSFSNNYKAHLVDAEHGLVGIHLMDYDFEASGSKYLLLQTSTADGVTTLNVHSVKACTGALDLTRAFFKDNGVYVFSSDEASPVMFLPVC